MKILYFGTAAIGVPLLRRCSTLGDIAGVVTSPDRPAGRGRRLRHSPVSEAALEMGLETCQPPDVNSPESVEWCRARSPDFIILFAYGQILSAGLLSLARWAINVHPSLLPRYRGAAPLQRAIMAGETETGVSVIQMSAEVDAGGILLSERLPIELDDTCGTLAEHASRIAPYLVEKAVEGLISGSLKPASQSAGVISKAPKIRKEERVVNWSEPAHHVHNLVRALSPEPLAYTLFRGMRLELIRSRVADEEGHGIAGTVVMDSGKLLVQCGAGFLELVRIKPEGKKEMDAGAFVNGYKPRANEILGS